MFAAGVSALILCIIVAVIYFVTIFTGETVKERVLAFLMSLAQMVVIYFVVLGIFSL